MNNDLTYGRNFADFLGSFWSSIFDKGALGKAIGYASSEMLLQSYMELMEVINSSSVYSIPAFSRRNVVPLIISESQLSLYSQVPNYGDGGYYGIQPALAKYKEGAVLQYGEAARLNASYFYPISNPNYTFGSVAINRLFEPSVTYSNGSDFVYSKADGGIIFKTNPFDNPLTPQGQVLNPVTGEVDKQIVLWFCDVDEDTFRLHNQYGFIFSNLEQSSEQYKQIIQSVFELVSNGPSLFRLDSFLSSISGSPLIREVSETVQTIQDKAEGHLVITDKNVYSLSSDTYLRKDIVVGATLQGGTPLSNVVEVVDTKVKNWWESFVALPLKPGHTTNTNGFLSFPNVIEAATYGTTNLPAQPLSRSVAFSLIGDHQAIRAFWKGVNDKAKVTGSLYGFDLFNKYSNSTDQVTDFTNQTEFYVNPAQILAEDLCSYSILPIRVNINNVSNLDIFFKTINPLKLSTPVHVILMLFLEINVIEQCQLASPSNQSQTNSINLTDLLITNVENFPSGEQAIWSAPADTGILEAISIEVNAGTGKKAGRSYKTPHFYNSDLDERGFLIEKFDLSNESNLRQTVELKLVPKCAL